MQDIMSEYFVKEETYFYLVCMAKKLLFFTANVCVIYKILVLETYFLYAFTYLLFIVQTAHANNEM